MTLLVQSLLHRHKDRDMGIDAYGEPAYLKRNNDVRS